MVENEEKRMERVRREGSETRGPAWLNWTKNMDAHRALFTLCTDLNTDCVPINYCMSVCETERT